MIAVAVGGVTFAGYTLGIWGYCLVRGYDVTFSALFHPTWPAGGGGSASGTAPLPADPGTGVYNV